MTVFQSAAVPFTSQEAQATLQEACRRRERLRPVTLWHFIDNGGGPATLIDLAEVLRALFDTSRIKPTRRRNLPPISPRAYEEFAVPTVAAKNGQPPEST